MINSKKREIESDSLKEKPKKKLKTKQVQPKTDSVEDVKSTAKTSISKKRESESSTTKEAPKKKLKTEHVKPKGKSGSKRPTQTTTEKPDWRNFKQKKKELRLKRKQTNKFYDTIVEAKKIFEVLRQRSLRGNLGERNKSISKLHDLIVGKGQYCKVIFAHDMARIVQFLFKFGNESIRKAISDELIPVTVEMLHSKYGRNCLKSMLKYGNGDIRSAAIKKMYGNAVKFCSHLISASVFEYAYSTWATPQHKHDLMQEFFGDIYKNAKDPSVKHLKDVYRDSPTMRDAALQTTKSNLLKVLNKELLDSALVQTVIYQYLSECNSEDKAELITQLAPHIVVISNSRDGARAAMQCIWHSTNKEKKVIMKAVKEHITELSKHEHGHCMVITLLDTVDDTVLLNKMIISQLTTDINELVADEHSRKVLLWLIAPGDSAHFHPQFIQELDAGRTVSTSKKDVTQRRQELLNYVIFMLTNEVIAKPEFWLSTPSVTLVTLAIIKAAPDNFLGDILGAVAKTVTNIEWCIEKEGEQLAVESPALHMMLKKLLQHDKTLAADGKVTFGKTLLAEISSETMQKWLTLNRGCFLLVALYENSTNEEQDELKSKLNAHLKILEKQKTAGAKILIKKLKER
ncbi:hypothetical protein PPYR_13462 [Photinus pyralis]|uniref:PUM-HD domain-containing protein n=1 Tax=Photinus pyralis TaxID=7054 RepID=A0A1Y1MBF6_PHOPY|nr:protein penguin [Photinus pyralis]KAB0793842.1 hypothetical protein PPYR_13462 [Photinus pyralis]